MTVQRAASKQSPEPFFLAQAEGFNGFCSNSAGIQFMQDIGPENQCLQLITDLDVARQSFLNPLQYYSSSTDPKKVWGLSVGIKALLPYYTDTLYNGQRNLMTNPVPVKVGQVWVLSTAAGTAGVLTEKTGAAKTALLREPVLSTTASGCSAVNVVKEAFYEIRYRPANDAAADSEEFGYRIASVTVDLVLQDKVEVPAEFCKRTYTAS